MKDIEYKTSPPTWHEYFQLFSSTGWMPVLKVSEDDLKKVFDNTWYWITAYKGLVICSSRKSRILREVRFFNSSKRGTWNATHRI